MTATTSRRARVIAVLTVVIGSLAGAVAKADSVNEFSEPNAIEIAGTSGALWFATPTLIGRLDSNGRLLASYKLPAHVTVINAAPGEPFPTRADGSMWFSAVRHNGQRAVGLIGHISVGGKITFRALPRGHGGPVLTHDKRGNFWFSDHVMRHHSRFVAVGELTRSGRLRDFRLPGDADVVGLSPGPGKQIWFTSCSLQGSSAYVGWVDRHGHIKTFSPHGPWCPGDIVDGPDGAMWFTAALDQLGPHQDQIGRITPSGTVKYFSAGTATVEPDGIAVGPDGALWFTEHSAPAIARMTTAGQVSQVMLPQSSEPTQIVLGPNKAIWFLDQQTGGYPVDPSAKIGVVTGGNPSLIDSLPQP
jgi:virginiamycin B lyase